MIIKIEKKPSQYFSRIYSVILVKRRLKGLNTFSVFIFVVFVADGPHFNNV